MGVPEKVHLTYADYRRLPEDGRRYELFEGTLEVSPSATLAHQLAVMRLIARLLPWIEERKLGLLLTAPLDTILSESTILQPDILFVSNERKKDLVGQWIHGAPDLCIEVLSPGTADRDRGIKRQLYARYGVKEYWLVDPETCSVTIHSLRGRHFRELVSGTGDRIVTSAVLAGFKLRPADLFSA